MSTLRYQILSRWLLPPEPPAPQPAPAPPASPVLTPTSIAGDDSDDAPAAAPDPAPPQLCSPVDSATPFVECHENYVATVVPGDDAEGDACNLDDGDLVAQLDLF